MRFFLIFIGFVFLNCNEVDEKENQPILEKIDVDIVKKSTIDSINREQLVFLDFYEKFAKAITEKDANSFNSCIHQEYGFFLIERPGGMPNVHHLSDFNEYINIDTWPSLEKLNLMEGNYKPKFEELPIIICDTIVYNKEGCFIAKFNSFLDTGNWFYEMVSPTHRNESEQLAESIYYTVVNTANYSYSFSFIDGRWYLSFLNIMVPCDA